MRRRYKIIGWVLLGYLCALITHYPYTYVSKKTELSPNKKYRLECKSKRFGGIILMDFFFYLYIREISTGKIVFESYIFSDEYEPYRNDVHWDGDKVVVDTNDAQKSDFDILKSWEATPSQTVFTLREGLATK